MDKLKTVYCFYCSMGVKYGPMGQLMYPAFPAVLCQYLIVESVAPSAAYRTHKHALLMAMAYFSLYVPVHAQHPNKPAGVSTAAPTSSISFVSAFVIAVSSVANAQLSSHPPSHFPNLQFTTSPTKSKLTPFHNSYIAEKSYSA